MQMVWEESFQTIAREGDVLERELHKVETNLRMPKPSETTSQEYVPGYARSSKSGMMRMI